MSKVDNRLKIKLYDSDSETETEEKKPPTSPPKSSDGRVSRAELNRPSRINSNDDDSRASSKTTATNKINHFSKPKTSKEAHSSPSSSPSPKNESPSNSSYSDTSVRRGGEKSQFERPKSSKPLENKKQPSRSSSSESESSSSSSSDSRSTSRSSNEQSRKPAPIKVNIERKPPVYQKKKPSSAFEKPESDSDRENSKKKDDSGNSSDVTDVSPLTTPKEVTISKQHKSHELRPPIPSHQPHHRRSNKPHFSEPRDMDRIDTSVLYDALNSEFTKKLTLSSHAASRPTSSKLNHTGNLNQTFDLSTTSYGPKLLRLEAENQKLYEKLLRDGNRTRRQTTNKAASSERPLRLTSSALNRQREQQRIEKENQLILQRLLEVKPSRDVQKEHQLRDYERNFGYLSLKILPISANSSFGRSRASSKRTSAKSSANNSRVSSAKSSAKCVEFDPHEVLKRTASLTRRPEWNDRW